MIYYYCDGSYAQYLKTIGCGIIRHDQKTISHFYRYQPMKYCLNNHEEYAIYQTLLLVEKERDKQTTIFNDNAKVVDAIINPKSNKRREINIVKIKRKIEELEKQGFRIKLKFKSERESEYIQMAHQYSRKYLGHDGNRKQVQLTKEKEVLILTIPHCIDKGCLVKTEEKSEIQEKARERTENEVDIKELKRSQIIIFKKISKKKWAAFNEVGAILCVSSHIITIATHVLEHYLQLKRIAVVNLGFKKCFKTYLEKAVIQKEHKKGIHALKEWEKQKKIAYVS